MKQHPLSALFPAMPPDQLLALAKDIKKNGLRQSIVMFEGQVLDGWHRYQACKIAGVACREDKYSGSDPAGFARSCNWHRRDMTASQRALTEVELSQWAPAGRQKATSSNEPVKTISAMANDSGTSISSIKDAKKVAADGAEVLKEAVKDKEISIRTAAEISKEPKAKQAKAIKAAKAPKPKPEKPADTVTMAEYEELAEELEALKDHCQDLKDELKTSVALMETEPAIEMQKLRVELKDCKRRRDELMANAVEMRKELGRWQARAKKAGWKPGNEKK